LKYKFFADNNELLGRAPRGARGLKYGQLVDVLMTVGSRPTRGAWIEIASWTRTSCRPSVAPHAGRVD